MTALIIILSILLLLLFLLFMPVTLYVDYGDERKISVRYLFVRLKLFPKKEKKKKNNSTKSEKKKKENNKSKTEKNNSFGDILKEKGLSGIISLLKEIISVLNKHLGKLRKHIIIKRFDLTITVASEDAAEAAINYGHACMAVYPVFSFICSAVGGCRRHNLNISVDYSKKETQAKAKLKASVRLLFLISAAVSALFKSVKLLLKIKGNE